MRGTDCQPPHRARLSGEPVRARRRRCAAMVCAGPKRASTKYEALGERVVRRDKELAAPGDPRASLDLGHDRVIALPSELARDATGEACADDALDDEGAARGETSARPLDGDPRRHAGAGRGSIDLALGEDADVARIGARAECRSGEDRPI